MSPECRRRTKGFVLIARRNDNLEGKFPECCLLFARERERERESKFEEHSMYIYDTRVVEIYDVPIYNLFAGFPKECATRGQSPSFSRISGILREEDFLNSSIYLWRVVYIK